VLEGTVVDGVVPGSGAFGGTVPGGGVGAGNEAGGAASAPAATERLAAVATIERRKEIPRGVVRWPIMLRFAYRDLGDGTTMSPELASAPSARSDRRRARPGFGPGLGRGFGPGNMRPRAVPDCDHGRVGSVGSNA
jgi:hypothetical protein